MPSKHQEKTKSRTRRGLEEVGGHVKKTITKLTKPKYATPPEILQNLQSVQVWIDSQISDTSTSIIDESSGQTSKSNESMDMEMEEDEVDMLCLQGLKGGKVKQEVEDLLKTEAEYTTHPVGDLVFLKPSTEKDKRCILGVWGKSRMVHGNAVILSKFSRAEYKKTVFEHLSLPSSSGISLNPKVSFLNMFSK